MTQRVETLAEGVTLYLGDCRLILPTLPKVDAVVTDPPYGEAMGFDGDTNPQAAAELARAVFSNLRLACRPGAYAACFWTMRSLDLLLDGVRQSEWSYARTLTMHVAGTARPHLSWVPRIQPIVLFRNGMRASELHDKISIWIKAAINQSGLSATKIAAELDVDSRLIMKWSRYRDPAWCLPTERHFSQLKAILKLDDTFDDELMSRDRRGLRKANRHYRHDLYMVSEGNATTKHPSEKPLRVVSHICDSLADNGETIIDPFMGSGTTGVAAVKLGRKFIGIEIHAPYFDIACRRIGEALKQPDMFIERPKAATQETLKL